MVAVSNIHNAPPWVASTAYALGDRVNNDAAPVKAYECTVAGTSAAAGGPVGTGTAIVDGGATWRYLSAADFTSISSWWASLPPTLIDAVECHLWNDAIHADTPELSGIVTAGVFNVTIRAASGESFKDHPKRLTNPMRYNPDVGVAMEATIVGTVDAAALKSRAQHVNVVGLQIKQSGGSSQGKAVAFVADSNTSWVVQQCILEADGSACFSGFTYWGGAGVTAVNNLMVMTGGAFGVSIARGWGDAEGNTMVRPSDAGRLTNVIGGSYMGNGMPFRNNIVFGFDAPVPTSFNGGGSFGLDGHNATDAPSMVGTSTGDIVNLPFDNTVFMEPIAAAGLDLRPALGSPVIDVGTSIVVSPGMLVDILDVVRPVGVEYNIGAWESLIDLGGNTVRAMVLA